MKPNVVLRQLSLTVASADQSYMPQIVTVSVGKNASNLRIVKETRIPGFESQSLKSTSICYYDMLRSFFSYFTGDYVIFENMSAYQPYVQINIKRCHSDGCDTRIRGVKTLGYR